jgi:hypothetical protein
MILERIHQLEKRKRGEVLVTSDSTTEVLSSGLQVEPVNKMKRRLRSIYYRRITVKGGEMIWVKTGLLPSDTVGKEYYLSKGFRLTPPEGTEFAEPTTKTIQALDEKDSQIKSLSEQVTQLANQVTELLVKQAPEEKVGKAKRGGG